MQQRWSLALGIFALLGAVFFLGPSSLNMGQRIKQFYSYSITDSLNTNGNHPLQTTIPCPSSGNPTRLWAEEPPVFHLGASFIKDLGGSRPWAFPLLVSFSILLMTAVWAQLFHKDSEKEWVILSVAFAPIFIRYSLQHFPDLMAAGFLILGALHLRNNQTKRALLFFILGATTKFLVILPIAFLLGVDAWRKSGPMLRRSLKWMFSVSLAALPFVLWLGYLKLHQIPNPFGAQALSGTGRHSGGWALLGQASFYSHFFTWTFSKGIGLPLTILFALALVRSWRLDLWNQNLDLWAWTISLPFSWLLIRQGSFTHDYYFLPYFFPMAVLAGQQLSQIQKPYKLIYGFAVVLFGLAPLRSLNRMTQSIEAIDYCTSETVAQSAEVETGFPSAAGDRIPNRFSLSGMM